MKKLSIIFCGLALMFTSCGGGSQKASEDEMADESTSEDKGTSNGSSSNEPKISSEEVNVLIQSIPSPLETTRLIEALGARYRERYLNDPDHVNEYATEFSQAVNLGIYGTDLGYINIYERQQDVLNYLDVVTKLANNLNVGQFFNLQAMQRLVSNKANSDSLLYITTSGFDDMSTYLNDQNRSRVSVAIIAGGWIEGLYLLTQVAKLNPSDKLDEKVGEQKVVLDNLITLTALFEGQNDAYAELHKGMEDLQKVYNNIEIEYKQSESTGAQTKEEVDEDMVMVEGTQESVAAPTPEQLEKIAEITDRLRTTLIKP